MSDKKITFEMLKAKEKEVTALHTEWSNTYNMKNTNPVERAKADCLSTKFNKAEREYREMKETYAEQNGILTSKKFKAIQTETAALRDKYREAVKTTNDKVDPKLKANYLNAEHNIYAMHENFKKTPFAFREEWPVIFVDKDYSKS